MAERTDDAPDRRLLSVGEYLVQQQVIYQGSEKRIASWDVCRVTTDDPEAETNVEPICYCFREEDAIQVRDALTAARPSLTWSREVPSEPGHYWHRNGMQCRVPDVVAVYWDDLDFEGRALVMSSYIGTVQAEGGEWSPRLTPPVEGEAGDGGG